MTVKYRYLIFAGLLSLLLPSRGLPYANQQFLVEPAWLMQHLKDADLRVVDMRANAIDYYEGGHIPGAVNTTVSAIRIPVETGGARLPSRTEGAKILGALGIKPSMSVVMYDDVGGLHASRLFFTLDSLGHKKMAILNGGIQGWQKAGFPLSREVPRIIAGSYRSKVDAEKVASAEWIAANLKNPTIALVDARSAKEYKGEDVRAKRGGHIPGAKNIEWVQNLNAAQTFKPAAELQSLYESQGITKDKTVVSYCQTHHRAAMTYFTLRLLGYPKVKGYDRSWAEWGNREDLPVER